MKNKRKLSLVLCAFIVVFTLTMIIKPSNKHIDIFVKNTYPVVYKGTILKHQTKLIKDTPYLTTDFIKEYLDSEVFIDEKSNSVIITTDNKVMRFPEKKEVGFINERKIALRFPVIKENDKWYMSIEEINQIYPVILQYDGKTKVTLMVKKEDFNQRGIINEENKITKIELRNEPSRKSPIVSTIKKQEEVYVLKEYNGWIKVQRENGYFGYLKENKIRIEKDKEKNKKSKPFQKDEIKGKINLTWEAVYDYNPNVNKIGHLKGVNVVSPTWFELTDTNGNIKNKASIQYIQWARQNNYKIWALYSNGFNPDWTHESLKNYDTRLKMIKQITAYAEIYKLDGINIDFENVYLKDKELLVQFMRELTPFLHEKGITVSMDITFKSNSEVWSMFLDRKKLAETVDYVMVMAYDEHWDSSPTEGSVSSIPWVEKGLREILKEVPNEKIILGMPLYTRVWEIHKGKERKIIAKTLSNQYQTNWILEKKVKPRYDEKTGQNYAEFTDKKTDLTYKVWFEDETSMKKRIQIMKKYNLSGIATWQRGFADKKTWEYIDNELKKVE